MPPAPRREGLQIGVVFPQLEIGSDPIVLRDFAQTAEGLGFSHLLAFDHVLGAEHGERTPPLWGPYTERDAFHEPLTLFSFLSGVTQRIAFATGVLVLPQRQTALVAKQAAEVALLSGDRLRLGVGTGWNYVEYGALGEAFATRGRRLDEQVAVLRELWTQPVVTFDGRWHAIERAGILPRPARPIPVWFGGFTAPAFERAARLGDGFMFARPLERSPQPGSQPIEVTVADGRQLRERVAGGGRAADSFGLEARSNYVGGPAEWQSDRAAVEAADFDYLAVNLLGAGFSKPADHLRALQTYAEVVGLRAGHGSA